MLVVFGQCLDGLRLRRHVAALIINAQLILAATAAYADCNTDKVVVRGTSAERASVCRALTEVERYFAHGRIEVKFELIVRFQDRVEIMADDQFAHAAEHWPVSGYYRAGSHELYMTRAKAPWTAERTPWHLPWDEEIEFSILEHEVIHAAIASIMGDNYRKLPHPWHEALAYAIEISLMKPGLRAKVLANFLKTRAFASTLEVNSMVYGLDPDAFSVAAYKTYLENNEIEWVKRAINFKFEMSDPMGLWPP